MSLLVKNISTDLHACTIEFYQSIENHSMFFCGIYELNENKQNDSLTSESSVSHTGEIWLIDYDNISGNHEILHKLICSSGVLDMKIVKDYLTVALSEGSLVIYKISLTNSDDTKVVVSIKKECSVTNTDDGYYLSIDIDLRLSDYCWIIPTNIAVSTQNGSIAIYQYHKQDTTNDNELDNCLIELYRINNAHVMFNEVMPIWTVAFDPHSINNQSYNIMDNSNNSNANNMMYDNLFLRFISGGDDCIMKLWEISNITYLDKEEILLSSSSILSNNKPNNISLTHKMIHQSKIAQAGVTSSQWHPYIQDIFVSGSYDEYLRIWDYRNILKGPLLEVHTGGGVWRCKWIEIKQNNCESNNINVIDKNSNISNDNIDNSIIKKYLLVTASMQYGCCCYEVNISWNHNLNNSMKAYQCYIIQSYHHNDIQYSNYLAYGIDVIHIKEDNYNSNTNNRDKNKELTIDKEITCVSCSFYDNLIQIWKFKL